MGDAVYDHQARLWRRADGQPLDVEARVRDALNGLRSLASEISDYGGEDARLASETYCHAADLVQAALDQGSGGHQEGVAGDLGASETRDDHGDRP